MTAVERGREWLFYQMSTPTTYTTDVLASKMSRTTVLVLYTYILNSHQHCALVCVWFNSYLILLCTHLIDTFNCGQYWWWRIKPPPCSTPTTPVQRTYALSQKVIKQTMLTQQRVIFVQKNINTNSNNNRENKMDEKELLGDRRGLYFGRLGGGGLGAELIKE